MKKLFLVFLFGLSLINCGGGSSSSETDDGDTPTGPSDSDDGDTVNLDKLIGTPFEDYEIGDDFEDSFFLCDQYKTESIDELPMQVFTAFFTADEEELIQEGVDLANDGAGIIFFEITDEWSDDVYPIFKVEELEDGVTGSTFAAIYSFNDHFYSEVQMADWAIGIFDGGANSTGFYKTIAHELGHAAGIRGHFLIDYESDSTLDLEDESLMSSNGGAFDPPAMTDYNFMMSMQGEIITEHLGEVGEISGGDPCE